jgi:hypothetical protein
MGCAMLVSTFLWQDSVVFPHLTWEGGVALQVLIAFVVTSLTLTLADLLPIFPTVAILVFAGVTTLAVIFVTLLLHDSPGAFAFGVTTFVTAGCSLIVVRGHCTES